MPKQSSHFFLLLSMHALYLFQRKTLSSRSLEQENIRKHATTPILASPSPVGHGWKLEDNKLQIVWGTQEPAPESILECVHCKCQKGYETRRCSCYKSDLKCTELCQCNSCENSDILADELIELETQFLENEFELEEDDVGDDDY